MLLPQLILTWTKPRQLLLKRTLPLMWPQISLRTTLPTRPKTWLPSRTFPKTLLLPSRTKAPFWIKQPTFPQILHQIWAQMSPLTRLPISQQTIALILLKTRQSLQFKPMLLPKLMSLLSLMLLSWKTQPRMSLLIRPETRLKNLTPPWNPMPARILLKMLQYRPMLPRTPPNWLSIRKMEQTPPTWPKRMIKMFLHQLYPILCLS